MRYFKQRLAGAGVRWELTPLRNVTGVEQVLPGFGLQA